MSEIIQFVESLLQLQLKQLASIQETDAMAIYGSLYPSLPELVRDSIEDIPSDERNKNLTILLHTGGGLIDSVERTVEVLRHHYELIDFIVPGHAMSAGTLFTLSGDNIYMNYFSKLGPIDPQFYVDGKWIPGLAYLEKFNQLNDKSEKGTLTPLEYGLALKLDVADIHQYEQAQEHSVELLEKWLSSYKFNTWDQTQNSQQRVTLPMKQDRAKEIALKLNDTKRWHSHSRGISMNTLQDEIGLLIRNFEEDPHLKAIVKRLHTLITDYMTETSEMSILVRLVNFNQSEDNHE